MKLNKILNNKTLENIFFSKKNQNNIKLDNTLWLHVNLAFVISVLKIY